MLVLDRATGAVADERFGRLPELLRAGDLLVLNDSRVLPARLFATRGGVGKQAGSPRPSGVVEVLLTEEQGTGNREQGMVWRALVKPAKKVRVGETLEFREASELVLTAEVVEAGEFGERTLRFAPVDGFYERVGRIGHMPLPPYIRRPGAKAPDHMAAATAGTEVPAYLEQLAEDFEQEDRERYQTVYSHEPGSAAAPTAGLHFTPEILAELTARGVEIQYITLHVGLGTFQPVRVSELKDIRLHAERYTLPAATAEALNRALEEGRRVVAVGTTTTRTLEHIAAEAANLERVGPAEESAEKVGFGVERDKKHVPGANARPISDARPVTFAAHSGATSIFIGPGHKFRVVSGLLTNFHLPESSLVMLVSAFAGREQVLGAYEHAIREGYRFYSYGDCMLVV